MDRFSSNEVNRQLNSSLIVTNYVLGYFILLFLSLAEMIR
jgi:hypothetical protein